MEPLDHNFTRCTKHPMENIMAQNSTEQTPAIRQGIADKAKPIKKVRIVLPRSIWQKCRARIDADDTDWNEFGAAAFLNYVETRSNSEPESRAA